MMKTITPFCFATLFAFNIYSQETIRIPDIGLEECLINLKIDSINYDFEQKYINDFARYIPARHQIRKRN